MATGTLEILARIPSLEPVRLEAETRVIVPPAATARAEASHSARRQPRRTVRFPTGSIVMLALIAAAVWTAAAWHERVRFKRQQPPDRWAEAFEGDAVGAEGVVR